MEESKDQVGNILEREENNFQCQWAWVFYFCLISTKTNHLQMRNNEHKRKWSWNLVDSSFEYISKRRFWSKKLFKFYAQSDEKNEIKCLNAYKTITTRANGFSLAWDQFGHVATSALIVFSLWLPLAQRLTYNFVRKMARIPESCDSMNTIR